MTRPRGDRRRKDRPRKRGKRKSLATPLPFSAAELRRRNDRRLALTSRPPATLTEAEREELARLNAEVDAWVAARYPLPWGQLEGLEQLAREAGLAGEGGT